ncbi:YadA family autotransporter adhesin [Aggregatibacter kilianii]|uniref:YadA family autotransporter adhesin n=1 Tax=Aggregatibacter kilianii TaxID=2025884 RepID=UPI0013A67B98|nr:YadA-like family protein [Aggregatibacter kilianii]
MKKSPLFLALFGATVVATNANAAAINSGTNNIANPTANIAVGFAHNNQGTYSTVIGSGNLNFANRVALIGNFNELSVLNPQVASFDANGNPIGYSSGTSAGLAGSARDSNVLGSYNKLFAVENNLVGSRNTISSTADYQNVYGSHNNLSAEQSHVVGSGVTTTANANHSLVFGGGTVVYDSNTRTHSIQNPTTISGQQTLSMGFGNTILGNKNVAIGSNITATGGNNVILGNDSSENSATVTNGVVNTATVDQATVGSVTYSGFAGKAADGVVSVGAANKERRVTNVAAGEINSASTDAINGSQLYMVANQVATNNDNIVLLKDDVVLVANEVEKNTAAITSVQGDVTTNTQAITTNTQNITANKQNIEANKQNISANTQNIAANKQAIDTNSQNIATNTQAITANQQEIATNKQAIATNKQNIENNKAAIDNVRSDVTQHSQAIADNKAAGEANTVLINQVSAKADNYNNALNARIDQIQRNQNNYNALEGKVTNLESKLDKTRKDLKGIGASSAAMASLPQAYLPGKSMLAVGTGTYEGASAIAVGYSKNSDSSKHVIKLNGSINTNSKASFGAGYGYQW